MNRWQPEPDAASVADAACRLVGMAARRAIDGLGVVPDVAVTDGRWDFVSPAVDHVELAVFDIAGRLVKTLVSGPLDADSEHVVTWNGKNRLSPSLRPYDSTSSRS